MLAASPLRLEPFKWKQRGSNLSNEDHKLRKNVALKGLLMQLVLDWDLANGVWSMR
jgi:hypothetical protein